MPKTALEIKATLENVRSFTLVPPYVFRVRQTGGTEERDDIEVDPEEVDEVFGSKGTVNFKLKFDKHDKFEATIQVLSQKEYSGTGWKRVAVFETRGLDLVEWKPTGAKVIAKSGTEFADADISDKDGFSEYDEDGNCSVSILELESRFVHA